MGGGRYLATESESRVMSTPAQSLDVRRGTIPVMAVACGVAVATLYICQPLLAQIAQNLGVPQRLAALASVFAQIGYTLGILFIVPLSDIAPPRTLVRVLLTLTILSLLAIAVAPGIDALLAATLIVSATSVIAQILIPIATTFGSPAQRGRIVGSLMTGVVLGILLSRTISGAVAQCSGTWRAPYLLEAVFVAALLFALPSFLPDRPTDHPKSDYFTLLRSLPALLRHRPLLVSMGLSFCSFGAFSVFWATLAFHLATPTFGLGPAAAGLFGVWGAPGALLAPMVGGLSDRWGSSRINAVSLVSMMACFAIAATLGTGSVAALIVAVNLLDFGQQSGQVANQTRIFGIGETIRGRLNTIYMATTFAGGALGALAAGYAWTSAGWHGVCALGSGLVGTAMLLLIASKLTSRRASPAPS
jgi:predicted MFS family arabinose efflux permease